MALITKIEHQTVFDLLLANAGAISGLFEFLEANDLTDIDLADGSYLAPTVLNADVVTFFRSISTELPVATGSGGVAYGAPAIITLNGADFLLVSGGASANIELIDQNDDPIVPLEVVGNMVRVDVPEAGACSGTASIIPTGQGGDPYGSFWTLPTGKLNVWGHEFRWCGITGGYTDGTSYFDVAGVATTRILAFPEGLACDLRHVDCDGNFPMYGMDGISTTGYVIYSVSNAYNVAYSTASFASGFRSPTINELDNCIYFPETYTYSQKPFEEAQFQWWSSTDFPGGNKYININVPARTFVPAAGASGGSFPVRTTNISEL